MGSFKISELLLGRSGERGKKGYGSVFVSIKMNERIVKNKIT